MIIFWSQWKFTLTSFFQIVNNTKLTFINSTKTWKIFTYQFISLPFSWCPYLSWFDCWRSFWCWSQKDVAMEQWLGYFFEKSWQHSRWTCCRRCYSGSFDQEKIFGDVWSHFDFTNNRWCQKWQSSAKHSIPKRNKRKSFTRQSSVLEALFHYPFMSRCCWNQNLWGLINFLFVNVFDFSHDSYFRVILRLMVSTFKLFMQQNFESMQQTTLKLFKSLQILSIHKNYKYSRDIKKFMETL